MARFYPSNSVASSGISSDDVTITSLDVPESKTALTADSDDKVIKGKLKEYNSASKAVGSIDNDNSRVQLTIPTRGLYSLTAKLFTSFSDLANLIGLIPSKIAQGESILGVNGAFKGLGDAKQTDVRSGKTFSTAELSEVPGTMAEHAGGTFKPGTSDKTVIAADRYLTGDVIVKGDPNLIAANIRKNVVIFGIKGTSDGWVVEEADIYNYGAKPFGLRISPISEGAASFKNDYIDNARQFENEIRIFTTSKLFLKKFTKINFEYTATSHATTGNYITFDVYSLEGEPYGNTSADFNAVPEFQLGKVNATAPANEKRTISLALTVTDYYLRGEGNVEIRIYTGGNKRYSSAAKIHRIWLSMD